MVRYSIFVGLNDSLSHKQVFGTEVYINTLKNICRSYRVPFSFETVQGGYIYNDGDYIEETTLHITLFDQPEETVKEIANDLCTFFNQESVMVTEDAVKMYYVNGENEVKEFIQSSCESPADETRP